MHIVKKHIALLLLFVLAAAGGCSRALKENEVYVVKDDSSKNIEQITEKLNTEGRSNFYDIGMQVINQDNESIPLTVTKDRKYGYYMSPSIVKGKQEELTIIKGESSRRVDIVKLELETGKIKKIASDIPFISRVKWNKDNTLVAFLGGNKLTIYDDEDNSLIQTFESTWGDILNFGWSFDSKKIYFEGANLINDGIYYIDSKKFVHAYETKEDLYMKEVLDDKYYYGTEGTLDQYGTVIVDNKLTVVKRLNIEGRIRDAYKLGIIQVGKNNFGLYYYDDINKTMEPKLLSKDYITDAKFIKEGEIAYITPNSSPEENSFFLYILDKQGEKKKVFEVSGSKIMIAPDGAIGYISGMNHERINFERLTLEKTEFTTDNSETEEVYKTIRGAVDVLYKYQLTKTKDYDGASKFFKDTSNPEQWAYTDIINIFNEGMSYSTSSTSFSVSVGLKYLDLREESCTASTVISARGSDGGGIGLGVVLELSKVQGKWFVTGLSTFPNSKQNAEVKAKAEEVVKKAVEGKIFDAVLKDKQVKIGQIQFWQLSEPHLADNIEYANYCKIYLKVMEEGKEVVYKLVLDKKHQNYWKESILSKDRLSLLF